MRTNGSLVEPRVKFGVGVGGDDDDQAKIKNTCRIVDEKAD